MIFAFKSNRHTQSKIFFYETGLWTFSFRWCEFSWGKILSRLMLVNFVVGVQKRHEFLRAYIFLRFIFPHETRWSKRFLFVIFIEYNETWIRCRRDVIKIFTVYSSLSTQQVCMCIFCYRKRPHFCHFAYITIDYQCVYVTLNFIALRKKIKMLCEHANKKLLSQE